MLSLLRGLGELNWPSRQISRLRAALATGPRVSWPGLPPWGGVSMSRRLLVLNALLLAAALAFAVYIARQLMTPIEASAPRQIPVAVSRLATTTVVARRESMSGYEGIARHNLFSPSRTETLQNPTAGVLSFPRPYLYGIVLTKTARVAYFEDPVTRRLAGYRVGDALIGGTLQRIDADRVVITRPDGPVDVRLRDPGKPRSAGLATAPPAGAPGPPLAMPPLHSPMPSSAPSGPPQFVTPQ